MSSSFTRKEFVRTMAIGSASAWGALYLLGYDLVGSQPPNELYRLSDDTLAEWAAATIKLQATDKSNTSSTVASSVRIRVKCPAAQHLPTSTGRLFNFVPGMEAVPLGVFGRAASFVIEVI